MNRGADYYAHRLCNPNLFAALLENAEPGFERDKFLPSVRGQSFRRNWRPSDAQARILNGIIDRMFDCEEDSLVVDLDDD